MSGPRFALQRLAPKALDDDDLKRAMRSLCFHCQGADTWCPLYPQQTTYCVEFRPYAEGSARHDAALLIAGGMTREQPNWDSQRRFRLLCEVITGER